jgi:hypothetical protein
MNIHKDWDWSSISSNINMNDVRKYPHFPWDRDSLSCNSNLELDIHDMYLPNAVGEWIWRNICCDISMSQVIKYKDRKWDRLRLSTNENLTIDVVHMDLPNAVGEWNWDDISENISIEEVKKHPDQPWSRYALYVRHDTDDNDISYTMNYIRSHRDEQYNKEDLYWYPNIEIDVLDMPNMVGEWNMSILCSMPRIHISDFRILLKYCSREDLSRCRDISIYWIMLIDRVGICKNPKWITDISILCSN